MSIRFALAQHDFLVGDTGGNRFKAEALIAQARAAGADLVLFPELTISGYPPEDLLLRPGFMHACAEAVAELASSVQGIDVVIGHPHEQDGRRFNAVSWMRDGRVIGRYFKACLPNYSVFDEKRYFSPGADSLVIELKGQRIGVIICEDFWHPGSTREARAQGAELLLVTNASPYRDDAMDARLRVMAERYAESGLPMAYCNLVSGQDDLVFDGRSMLVDRDGRHSASGPFCEEALLIADFDTESGRWQAIDWPAADDEQIGQIYRALVFGLREYVAKNHFEAVVLGLSGGVDSALTLAIAVDALGPDRVHTVMMPSRHTSGLSIELAQEQAVQLRADHRCISIEPAFEIMLTLLSASFAGHAPGVAEENLQARLRGNIVMALSNQFGWLALATGNKSELAVGYCTLYGDMCGGYAPLKDCYKTRVYELAAYRNRLGPAIPEAVIRRPPSAELRPNQLDADSLPPYPELDAILYRYIEQDWSIERIVEDGFDEDTVRRVARLVLVNEYKRRQAPPGTKITERAFGRDRRYPMTSGWKELKGR